MAAAKVAGSVETRGVLAGAYRGGMRALLTHAVELDGEGREVRVLCSRVTLDSLADPYALNDEQRQGPPTCPTCLARRARAQAA